MLVDYLNQFCDNVALNTGTAGTYLIGSQIDLTTARDIGSPEPIYLVIQMTASVNSSGSTSITFKLASDATPATATDGSATEHVVTADFAKADLSAGTVVYRGVLPMEGAQAYERYLGILQVTTGNAVTAGSVDIFLTNKPPKWQAYADGDN